MHNFKKGRYLIQALYDVLPNKAKTIMDRLIAVSQDAVIQLGGEPSCTEDYVSILKYVCVCVYSISYHIFIKINLILTSI